MAIQTAAYLVVMIHEVQNVEWHAGADHRVRAGGSVLSRRLQLQGNGGGRGGPGDPPVVLQGLSDVHGEHPVGCHSVACGIPMLVAVAMTNKKCIPMYGS